MPYCMQCGHQAHRTIPAGDTRPRLVCPDCGHIHYDNPKVVGGCILVHEDKVLLCRRAIEPRHGYWTLPAGFMEIGETMQEGANRECWEEAHAVGTELQLYCLFDIPQLGQIHTIYLGKLQEGNFGVGEESLECALFAEDELPWTQIAFESGTQALRYYFADRKAFADKKASKWGDFPVHQLTLKRDFQKPTNEA